MRIILILRHRSGERKSVLEDRAVTEAQVKPGIHPEYGEVAFRDRSTGDLVVTKSTLVSQGGGPTVEVDGRTLPVFDVDVSSYSHGFWTGKARTLDSEGRVQRFRRRYGASS